ncbi:hypothetical protein Tco_0983212 [Tanacetum coccineum]
MRIKESILAVGEQKVSLHEEDVGYKETNMDCVWYLDNGASNHMTGVREHFKELDEEVSGKVRFGDGSYIEIKGKGSILIECDDEKQRIISHDRNTEGGVTEQKYDQPGLKEYPTIEVEVTEEKLKRSEDLKAYDKAIVIKEEEIFGQNPIIGLIPIAGSYKAVKS